MSKVLPYGSAPPKPGTRWLLLFGLLMSVLFLLLLAAFTF
jgi:hypothetical protein